MIPLKIKEIKKEALLDFEKQSLVLLHFKIKRIKESITRLCFMKLKRIQRTFKI